MKERNYYETLQNWGRRQVLNFIIVKRKIRKSRLTVARRRGSESWSIGGGESSNSNSKGG